MSDPDADLAELFRDESAQRLDQMDTALLAVESGAAGAETIDSLFRNAHTIKGAAGMLGFDDVRALAHAAEDVLASMRAAEAFPPEFAPPLLRATAALRAQINADGTAEPVAGLLKDLAACRAARTDGETPGSAPGAVAAAAPNPASPATRERGRGRRADIAGSGREDRPSARRGRRDHAVPDQAGSLAGRAGRAARGRRRGVRGG